MSAPVSGPLRIGAFSERVGVSASVLRAWESRYGLFTPERTAGGFRLYGAEDERRASRMRGCLEHGMAASESARLVLAETPPAGRAPVLELRRAWEALDVGRTHRALDELLGGPAPEIVVSRSILPLLRHLDEGWRRDPATRGYGHFASRTLETRLLAHAGRWHEAAGPLALIGCAPGEQHTLGTIAFGLALNRKDWRIAYLGADTPVDAFASAARALGPQRVVVVATVARGLERAADELTRLARQVPLALAGQAVHDGLAEAVGAIRLAGDPLDGALALAH
jgi:DNA-binding transcriptional MerR regulator